MKKGTLSYIIISTVSVLLVVADQVVKDVISKNITPFAGEIKVIDNFLSIVNWHNTGGAWGIFSSATIVLSIVSLIAVAFMIFLYVQLDSKFLKLCLGLLSAGALGNIIDRIRLGYVVDFLNFYNLFGYGFPAFNIADICVTSGAIGLVIYLLFMAKKHPAFREGTLASKIKI